MEASEAIFLGMGSRELTALGTMIVMFAFAVWFGATRCRAGIDEEEQERRTAAMTPRG